MPIVNAPSHANTGGFEVQVKPTPPADATAGKAICLFEARVTQETGTH